MDLLGYDYQNKSHQDLVRRSYEASKGNDADDQPFHEHNRDICYFFVQPVDDSTNRQIDTVYQAMDQTKAKQINSYNRVIELQINFYGANAYDKAVLLRMDLLEPSKNHLLIQNGLRIINDVADPFPAWERFNNKWWPRVDLSIRFNNTVTDERNTVNYIASAEIIAVTEQEEKKIIVKDGE